MEAAEDCCRLEQPRAEPARRPQIDGLRALAMVGVLYVHLYNDEPVTGGLRVALFFTVSGFLITHILWTAKERGESINIMNFYIRRALRLFPALAVLVLVGALLDVDGLRSEAFWHLFQMSNVRFTMLEEFKPWVVSHLWSLNVLEQFYLIWPLVILLLPLPLIYPLTISLTVALCFVQANADHLGIGGWAKNMVFSGAPCAFGAFAYLLQGHEPTRVVVLTRWSLASSAAVLFSPLFMWEDFGQSLSYRFLCMPALSIVVVGAFNGYRGPLGWALGSPAAQFVSRISYGVFVYHLLIWWVVGTAVPSLYTRGFLPFLIVTVLTMLTATASWYLIERPIARFKSRFPTAPLPGPKDELHFAVRSAGLPPTRDPA
ncbi:MAG: acyltransferase [Paracoccaceae bacterium]